MIFYDLIYQAGCDELTGATRSEASATTSKRNWDLSGDQK